MSILESKELQTHIRCVALKEAIYMTISRRIFISAPIIIYLNYKYPQIHAPLVVEALIFGFFGSIIHDYILKLSFFKKQIER